MRENSEIRLVGRIRFERSFLLAISPEDAQEICQRLVEDSKAGGVTIWSDDLGEFVGDLVIDRAKVVKARK